MSSNRTSTPVNGIILVNKPQGLTSNVLLQKVKRLYGAQKAGHTGSLDPLATGMLPICLGEATKFCQYLLDADKCYETTGLLGIKTNTADSMGDIVWQAPPFKLSADQLQESLPHFTGLIKQIPSMFSALKHKGVPLYKLAREGQDIPRQARTVSIYDLEFKAFRDNNEFDLKVLCSKGTYIRNLVEDIGDYLKVGAHVIKLHRVYTAGFADEKMYDLTDLQAKSPDELLDCLLPMQRAVHYMPAIRLSDDEILRLRQGKPVEGIKSDLQGCVQLLDEAGCFLGLGDLLPDSQLKVRRLLTESAVLTTC